MDGNLTGGSKVAEASSTDSIHSECVCVCAGSASAAAAVEAAPLESAVFSGGDWPFLEAAFGDLRYAGVRNVQPGFIGAGRVRGVYVE